MEKKFQEMNNIVKIGNRENKEKYFEAIVLRMNPYVYNKYGCIKISVKASLIDFTELILFQLKYAGIKIIKKEKKAIETSNGYTIPDAYEITLKKIPTLEQMQEEE